MDYNSIVFREFTSESLRRIERYRQEQAERIASDRLQQQTIREDDSDQHSSVRKRPLKPQAKRTANKELAVGQTLPRVLQTRFPAELIGKPIEEIDAYYRTEYVSSLLIRLSIVCVSFSSLWLSIEIKRSFDLVQLPHVVS